MADSTASRIEEIKRRAEQAQQHQAHPQPQAGAAAPAADGEDAPTPEVNTPAFGYYRGVRERAAYLVFQRLKGSWPSLGYAWLVNPEFVPSGAGQGQAIVFHYASGHQVTLTGRNLQPLHARVVRQQVYRVSEMGRDADRFLPETETVIYAIDVQAPALPDSP